MVRPAGHDARVAGGLGLSHIVVTGSECTGKTTLARELARALRTNWVPEFSRPFAASLGRALTAADVGTIARGQIDLADAALRDAEARVPRPAFLVHDTDLVSTVVYATHYYGSCPEWIVKAAHDRLAPLYLLADIDVPWIPDGVRDRPEQRSVIHALFRDCLANFRANVHEIHGLGPARLQHALNAVSATFPWAPTQ